MFCSRRFLLQPPLPKGGLAESTARGSGTFVLPPVCASLRRSRTGQSTLQIVLDELQD